MSTIIYSTTAAITKSGQVSLPREIANRLGLSNNSRLKYNVLDDGTITIDRELSFWEKLDNFHNSLTPAQKKKIATTKDMTVDELKSKWANSAKGKAHLKEKYGL